MSRCRRFSFSSYSFLASRFDFSPFGEVATEAVFCAAALHALWLLGCYWWLHETVSVEALFKLASSDAAGQVAAIKTVEASKGRVSAYLASLLAFSYFAPPAVRSVITRYKWDRSSSPLSTLFRFRKAPWYYLLTGADFEKGQEPDLVVARGEQAALECGSRATTRPVAGTVLSD
jgi:hypothetical protein